MFGYDEAQLEKIRTRRALNRWVILGILLLGGIGGCALGGLWLIATPEGLRLVVTEVFRTTPFEVTLGDVEVDHSAGWHPASWRIHVLDVQVDHPDPAQIDASIARLVLPLPNPLLLLRDRRLHFPFLQAIGLHIEAHQQRPNGDWEPRHPALRTLTADRVQIWDARYTAPEDPPLSSAAMTQIYGELHQVSYELGTRKLDAVGTLTASSFRTGSLEVERVRLSKVVAEGSDLQLEGVVWFAGARAGVHGSVGSFHRTPAVELTIQVANVPVERAIANATGRESPLTGRLDAWFTLRSGGSIPRGHGVIHGTAHLTDSVVPLDRTVNPWLKDLIRIAPYLILDDHDRVVLSKMEGELTFTRGTVDLHRLVYHAPRREIEIRGHLDDTGRELIFRLVPARDPHKRPGLGIVLHSARDQKLQFRLAKRDELLPGVSSAKD